MSAAGVEVESEGSSRVQAASEECLSLSACGRSGCGAAGERRERERRGEAEMEFMQLPRLIQNCHQKSGFKSAVVYRWTTTSGKRRY